ncbi:MAG: hypothetical protein C0392_05605 [Syntrophus sp. (in: bacteria)]|nr:hypothetical protein [Syntrophus sp. (in: bacteria)]
MNKIVYVMAFILIFIFNSTMLKADECTIYWLHPDQPPLSIKKGYGAGMGSVDRTEEFFKNHLKDCTHITDGANYERIVMLMKQKEDACCIALYKNPEREKFVEFSIPYRVVLSNALIILESQKGKFEPFIDNEGHIPLEGLIKKGYRIGVAKGRVYRGIIDEVLNKYKGDPRIIEHTASQNMVGSLIGMMTANRIDATIGYPSEAQYVAKTMDNKTRIISIPISGMADYGLTPVGCSKTEKGKMIIKRLNSIIMKYRMTPEFLDHEGYWLDSSGLKRFQEYSIKEFKK